MTVAEYTKECSRLNEEFNLDPDAVAELGEAYSWADVAAVMDGVHAAYASLEPPVLLGDYHNAAVDFYETYRDVAQRRPADQSFAQDYSIYVFAALPGLLQIGMDENRTEAEQIEQADAFMEEKIGEYFGPEFQAAHARVRQALSDLPEETSEALTQAACPIGTP